MPGSRPNIVLISADSLRADRLGCYGYPKPTSPHLDRFALDCTLFRTAFSNGPNTPHAFPALLAGRNALLCEKLGLFDDRQTLAEALKAGGYTTLGFNAGNPYVSRAFRYDRGFDEFHDFVALEAAGETPGVTESWKELRGNHATYISIPAGDLENYLVSEASIKSKAQLERQFNGLVFERLRRQKAAPFFLWLHYMDTHYPYLPQLPAQLALGIEPISREENLRLNTRVRESMEVSQSMLARISELYNAAVRQLDAKIAEVFSFLQSENLYENTLIIFVADHGEEFLEHGDLQHKSKLFDELLHVPLLVKQPGQTSGEIRTGLSGTLQIPATIAKAGGLAGAPFGSRTLVSPDSERPGIFAAASYGRNGGTPVDRDMFRTDRMPKVYALRTPQWKLIYHSNTKRFQLFNLISDPSETADLFPEAGPGIGRLRDVLKFHIVDLERARVRRQVLPIRNRISLEMTNVHAI